MTIDQLVGAARTVTVAGRQFKVSPLKMREWGEFQRWLKDNGRSPVGSLRADELDALPDEYRDKVIEAAVRQQRQWPPFLLSQEWFKAVSDAPNGDPYLVHAILSRDNPEVTMAYATDLLEKFDKGDWLTLIDAATDRDTAPK